MMMKILLLIIMLTSCVSGTFVVNVTQSSYQAEENQDITLEWTFTTNNHTSSNSLIILCHLLTDLRPLALFYLHGGVEVPKSQDEQFAGRVQWDKDVLREGRIRLHVSRLRNNDSGLYVCKVFTSYGRSSGKCWLNVSVEHRLTCPQTIEAAQGDDAIIQCQLDPPVDLSDYTLDVTRLDLGIYGDVYSYRRGEDQQDDQMDRYRDRTTINHEDLIRGIVTLKISSVTLSDSGPYKVYIKKLRARSVINITVGSAKEESVWKIVLASVFGVGTAAAAAAAVVVGAVGVGGVGGVGGVLLLLLVKRGVIWKKM
ncbi:uncharacterized protein LOC114548505 [Perca flavescens]|uniref:uncharacterized protein LOC114548505 n=1 Tax=Perca flavescens TaxID=8167 RepID=UPI00106ED312|nr:uncharacterized protein LOC114548505 [Perca flavescens]XP_028424296.1 uncharacterized protein LOC114548505 [Perca flavescens]XP_028424307.1 uncharacterized protein LOC114548505 [Perca flavescens]